MNNEAVSVKTFFHTFHAHLSDAWLESCIHWCKTEILGPNYTQQELQTKVYEQWLFLDLRDVEVRALPPALSTQQHFVLNGNFCLQVMQVVDISKPKMWQLQKIRNSNALTRGTEEDADVVGIGKRLLQLTFTDGVQEVEAMEYRPILSLSVNMRPGIKIRIMGPVIVRRGRLMLEPQNVKVLGGEVEALLVANAAENVLARALKLPENPNPVLIEELPSGEQQEAREGFQSRKLQPYYSENLPAQPVVKKASTRNEKEKQTSMEVDQLLREEEEFHGQQQTAKSKEPDLFDDVELDDADFENFDRIITSTQVQPVMAASLDDDIFDNIDIDAHLNCVREESSSKQPKIITTAKVLSVKNDITKGMFHIKAKFKSVVEKLTINEDEYKLVIKVEDDSGELEVRLHSDLIADFAEYSPAAITSLKKNVLNKDQVATEKVMEAIQKVKDKLLQLDHTMALQVEKNKIPVIIRLL